MEPELEHERLAEFGDGAPFLLGLMISLSLSLGLWMAAWWIGSMLPR